MTFGEKCRHALSQRFHIALIDPHHDKQFDAVLDSLYEQEKNADKEKALGEKETDVNAEPTQGQNAPDLELVHLGKVLREYWLEDTLSYSKGKSNCHYFILAGEYANQDGPDLLIEITDTSGGEVARAIYMALTSAVKATSVPNANESPLRSLVKPKSLAPLPQGQKEGE